MTPHISGGGTRKEQRSRGESKARVSRFLKYREPGCKFSISSSLGSSSLLTTEPLLGIPAEASGVTLVVGSEPFIGTTLLNELSLCRVQLFPYHTLRTKGVAQLKLLVLQHDGEGSNLVLKPRGGQVKRRIGIFQPSFSLSPSGCKLLLPLQ